MTVQCEMHWGDTYEHVYQCVKYGSPDSHIASYIHAATNSHEECPLRDEQIESREDPELLSKNNQEQSSDPIHATFGPK